MTFANEIRDFISGYTAVSEVGQKKRQLDISEKGTDAQISYQQGLLDLKTKEFDLASQKYREAAGRAGEAAARRTEAERVAIYEAKGASPAGTVTSSDTGAFTPSKRTGEAISFRQPAGLGWDTGTVLDEEPEAVPGLRRGGLVQKANSGGLIQRRDGTLVAPAPSAAIADELYRDGIVGPRYIESELPAPPDPPAGPEPTRPALPSVGRNPERPAEPHPFIEWLGRPPAPGSPAAGRNPERPPPEPPAAATDEREQARREQPDRPAGAAATDEREQARREQPGRPTAIPEEYTPPAGRRTDLGFGNASRVVVGRTADAVTMVLQRQEEKARAGGTTAIGPGSDRNEPDLVTGNGAYTPQELDELYKAIDPNNRLPTYLKSSAVLAEAWTYFMERGETEKAYNIATKILAGEKQLSQTLGMLAMEALKQGDTEAVLRLLGDAASRFPTGHEILMDLDSEGVLQYVVRQHGEEVERGALTGAQLMQLAGQMANGELFMKDTLLFAEANKPKPKSNPTAAINAAIDIAAEANNRIVKANAMLELARSEEEIDPEQIAGWEAELKDAKIQWSTARRAALDVSGGDRVRFDADVAKLTDSGGYLEFEPPPPLPAVRPDVGDDGGTGGDGTSEGNLPPPAPGTIETHDDGSRWRFKGGDANNPANWEKVSQ